MKDLRRFLIGAAIAAVTLLIVWTFSTKRNYRAECLALGFPEYRHGPSLWIPKDVYCYKRVHNTDSLYRLPDRSQ